MNFEVYKELGKLLEKEGVTIDELTALCYKYNCQHKKELPRIQK